MVGARPTPCGGAASIPGCGRKAAVATRLEAGRPLRLASSLRAAAFTVATGRTTLRWSDVQTTRTRGSLTARASFGLSAGTRRRCGGEHGRLHVVEHDLLERRGQQALHAVEQRPLGRAHE